MAKVVKSIRLANSIVKLLEDMGQFYSEFVGEDISTSKLYSQVLCVGLNDFWDDVLCRMGQKDTEQSQEKQKEENQWENAKKDPGIFWEELKLRAEAMRISMDEHLGQYFIENYFGKESATHKNRIKVQLEFDKSWEKRNKIELNWILEKCKIGHMIQTKEIEPSLFQKKAKTRGGILHLAMAAKSGGDDSRSIYYVKSLLDWDERFLESYGVGVVDVSWEENHHENSKEEENIHGMDTRQEMLKSMRMDEQFLELAQDLCDIESRLLSQGITLNGMLNSMLRQGALHVIHMLMEIEKSVHKEIRIGGWEKESLQKWETFVQAMVCSNSITVSD